MKKALLSLTILALAMGGAQAAKITVWTHFGGGEFTWLDTTAKKYMAANPSDTIELVNVPFGDIKQKMILGAPKGEGADLLLTIPHDQIGEMAASGVLEPMGKYVKNTSDLNKTAVTAMTYKGQVFGLPMFAEAVAVVYNKKLVSSVPTNWDDFLKLSTKLTDVQKGTFGYLADLGNSYMQYGVISAYGGYIFKNKSGTLDIKDLGIGNSGSAKAMGFLNDLRYKYNLIPEGVDGGVAKAGFLDGTVAMYLTGPWDVADIRKAKIDYGIAAFPKPPGAKKAWSPFVGVQGVLLNAYSKNKEAAAKFAEFMVMPENQISFQKAGGGRIPVSKKAVEALASDIDIVGFNKNIAAGTPMPNVPQMGAVWGPWGNAVGLSTAKPKPDFISILAAASKEVSGNIK